jgi:DNA polymerase III subunit chi
MTQIDFYLLAANDPGVRWDFCCRLIEKIQRLGHKVLVSLDTEEDARAFDQLLWSFKPESFVAHRLLGDTSVKEVPVEITFSDEAGDHHDVLLNLGKRIPPFFSRFTRVSEFVTEDEATKVWTREHYRFYKERGYPIETRPIEAQKLR